MAKKRNGQTNPPRRKPKAAKGLGRALPQMADGSARQRKCGMRISDCGLNAQSRKRKQPVSILFRRAGVDLKMGSLCVYSQVGSWDGGWL